MHKKFICAKMTNYSSKHMQNLYVSRTPKHEFSSVFNFNNDNQMTGTNKAELVAEVSDGFKTLFENTFFADMYRQRNGTFMPNINSLSKPQPKREVVEVSSGEILIGQGTFSISKLDNFKFKSWVSDKFMQKGRINDKDINELFTGIVSISLLSNFDRISKAK
jgi:agmatine/peptidylarginine deiminase